MFLRTKNKVVETPKYRRFKSLFCKHEGLISGEQCSKSGLCRISGFDIFTVCVKCGKIVSESHIEF